MEMYVYACEFAHESIGESGENEGENLRGKTTNYKIKCLHLSPSWSFVSFGKRNMENPLILH